MPIDPRSGLRAATWAVWAGSLGAAAVLVLVRLGDPSSRRMVELVTLTPLGLPLALVGVVSAVALTAGGARRRQRLALALALALAVPHAWWLAPLYVGARPTGGTGSMVVLTQNFEYGDAADLAAATKDHDVDVLVLLEVSPQHLEQLLATGIESWLPHSVVHQDHDHAVGTVVLSRVPVTGTRPLFPDADSQVVDLVDEDLGRVTLVAIHTRPPYSPRLWRADHDQTHAALSRIRDDEGAAVVLAGDFNATLAHAPMRRILALGFHDAAVQANEGWSATWPSGEHQRRLGVTVPAFAAIDHVLTSPSLVVTRSGTLEVAAADHKAVLATISLPLSGSGE